MSFPCYFTAADVDDDRVVPITSAATTPGHASAKGNESGQLYSCQPFPKMFAAPTPASATSRRAGPSSAGQGNSQPV